MQERDPIERTSKESDVVAEFNRLCFEIHNLLLEYDKEYKEDFDNFRFNDIVLQTAVGFNTVTIGFSVTEEDNSILLFVINNADNSFKQYLKQSEYRVCDGMLRRIDEELSEKTLMSKGIKTKIIRSEEDDDIIGVLTRIQEDLRYKYIENR